MADVAYLGAAGDAQDARRAVLEAQKLSTGDGPGATVTVIDGTGVKDADLDAQVEAAAGSGTQLLVIFELSHGISHRDRREALMDLGAADVMTPVASEKEFLTSVRALLHRSRAPKVLIVEDEDKVGEWARDVLAEDGKDVERVATLADALTRFEAGPIDALVVDRQLPDGDGLDFVAKLRKLGIRTPALLFTALDDVEEQTRGLIEAGAEDYICKPVHEDVLKARVNLIMRLVVQTETMVFGPLEIGGKDRIVRWRGERIELRRKEADMLIYLAERAGIEIPQRVIYQDVWGKVYMEIGANPITAARHRMVRDIKAFLKDRGETYPEFIDTVDDAYVFLPERLLRLTDTDHAAS